MTTNITTFEQNVKNKVKEIISDLIPEEQYNAIVASAVKEFREKELPNMVKQELRNTFSAIIIAEVEKPEWRGEYMDGTEMTSEAVKQMLIKFAPEMLSMVIGNACQNAITQFKYSLQSGARY